MACSKHEPELAIPIPANFTASDRLAYVLSNVDLLVRCKNCGMPGTYTHGRQKAGRRRPRWFRYSDGAERANQRIAELTKWIAALSASRAEQSS